MDSVTDSISNEEGAITLEALTFPFGDNIEFTLSLPASYLARLSVMGDYCYTSTNDLIVCAIEEYLKKMEVENGK